MAIHFDRSRMEEVIDNHERWWRGELDRPLIKGTVLDMYPAAHISAAPILTQANCNDFSWSAEQLIDAMDSQLSRYAYFADGYPHVSFDSFGPGILAAMCGSKLDNSTGRVWFLPCEEDLSKLHVHYDPDNIWSKRIKDIYRAGLDRWNGSVIMGLPDLGGVLDILASLCGTENLLFGLVDVPEEVHRLIKEIETAWYAAYFDFAEVLKPQGVYTEWNGILSKTPSYMPQCDFSYMLGPDMFEEFVLETLRDNTNRLGHTIYHLDGVGALKHLDMLLSLEKLNAIQWVYGEGQPGPEHWIDVYRKILDAGKQIMIIENPLTNGFTELRRKLNCSPYAWIAVNQTDFPAALRLVEK